ncbi:zinc-dependent alcohol dehydrogenase family protein [Mycolicibacterium bacteremicum]|uniref:NADPH:quinone oxidoreductase n=1 Tax=Mycolicibacterium bacteremicum TaxID=564198 RepID=A0A1W9YNK4_MYCBA|nr:zinc-dependent alcohol dehydrogenase family protein [Mycolicibacterium bacteremicum]MCV7432893.1 zinc-dependent alcohol dehydrogenase family protein [Mycolicibacterium bacteremicum]ORA01635.1 NADPH:quinone oxidoreductase [Mycolicibacterium bacteremicum]
MTESMKAVVLTRFGGTDALELREVPVPPVGPRQVRVRVHATAVNPLDYQIRRGDYPDEVPLPAIIGHDISGVIEQVGTHVTEFRPGDAVYYTPQIFGGPGSYAEQHVADVDLVGRKPENLSHLEAASLTLVGGTVWESLVTRAGLTVGETVLIHGGAGGVGTIAIQIARAIGARVLTTARAGDEDFVRSLGADAVIDYASADYVDAVAELTRGAGVDVVFDTIGGDTLTRSPLVLADLGRVVSIVDIAQPQNLIQAWGRNAAYHFVFTRQNRGKLDALTTLAERGLVTPVIGATLPLARTGEAHDLLENRRSYVLRGKVAIDVVGDTVALPPRVC